MQTVYLCLIISGVMPILCAATAKWGFKDFDNSDPRSWLSKQTGFRARANAAQANSFEAFPFFAVGVFCALNAHVDLQKLSAACVGFVLARALFILFYVIDKPTLRTVAWCAAFFCGLFNFVAAISAS